MQFLTRLSLAKRRPWVLLVVAALLGVALAARANVPSGHEVPPGPPPASQFVSDRYAGARGPTPIVVNFPAYKARSPSVQSTPPAVRGAEVPTALHLRKVVVNEGGGTAVGTDWTLSAAGARPDGATNLSGPTPVDSGPGFLPDIYTLSETFAGSDPAVAERYEASGWSCVDDATGEAVEVSADGRVQVNEGDEITCTITNRYRPPGRVKIVGRKLYKAWTGPLKDREVGLSGWVISARLAGGEAAPITTATNVLGEWEFSEEALGGMAFPGAVIRICEEDRAGWVHLTPACVEVTLPDPLPPDHVVVVPDFTNAQEMQWVPGGNG